MNDEVTNAVSGAFDNGKLMQSTAKDVLEAKRNLIMQKQMSNDTERVKEARLKADLPYEKEFDEEFEKLYKKDID